MATTVYIRVTGKRQGTFKGEVNRKNRGDNWSQVFSYNFHQVPASQGQSAESVQFEQQLEIMKTFASPAFFEAQVNGEFLSLVEFEWARRDSRAGEIIDRTWTLTDVLIVSYDKRYQGGDIHLEAMTLSFTSASPMAEPVPPDWNAGVPSGWGW
jgi:type VI secretion system Hcp family effector